MIRGGAIGDFILTLPAVKALRNRFRNSRIEILGYKHIAALAENRFYAQAVQSIEYGPLSSFFTRETKLPAELANYFSSFDLIVSYLYDPDRIFESNLKRAAAQKILVGPGKIDNSAHAARQLARPIEKLGIKIVDLAAKFYPSEQDRQFARDFLRGTATPIVVMHPGSGSETKNWPLENWIDLGNRLIASEDFTGTVLVVSGEADQKQTTQLETIWRNRRVQFANNLALPHLGALLENAVFVGHDSGISHLAAAAGANCVLLFGPTDPAIWAPLNENVRVIQAPGGDLRKLDVNVACDALDQALMRIGMIT